MEQFEAFCGQVLHYISHATPKERRAVKQELREHLEDRAQALTEQGVPAEEATVRAVSAMGNPETIGRELNRQFPLGWLVLSRVALALCMVFVVLLLSPVNDTIWRVVHNLQAEYAPMAAFDGSNELERRLWHHDLGLTAKVLDTTVRVYDIAGTETGIYVYFFQYAENPFQTPIRLMGSTVTFPTRGGGYYGPFDSRIEIPIDSYSEEDGLRLQREDLLIEPDYVRISYDRNGFDFSFVIPLAGGETP